MKQELRIKLQYQALFIKREITFYYNSLMSLEMTVYDEVKNIQVWNYNLILGLYSNLYNITACQQCINVYNI